VAKGQGDGNPYQDKLGLVPGDYVTSQPDTKKFLTLRQGWLDQGLPHLTHLASLSVMIATGQWDGIPVVATAWGCQVLKDWRERRFIPQAESEPDALEEEFEKEVLSDQDAAQAWAEFTEWQEENQGQIEERFDKIESRLDEILERFESLPGIKPIVDQAGLFSLPRLAGFQPQHLIRRPEVGPVGDAPGQDWLEALLL